MGSFLVASFVGGCGIAEKLQKKKGDKTSDYAAEADASPAPVEPFNRIIYDGETVPFAAGVAYDTHDSSITDYATTPHSGTNHLRAIINVKEWDGAVSYMPYLDSSRSWKEYDKLTLYIRAEQEMEIRLSLIDAAHSESESAQSIFATTEYKKVSIDLYKLAPGMDIGAVQGIIFAVHHDLDATHVIDIDDIALEVYDPASLPQRAPDALDATAAGRRILFIGDTFTKSGDVGSLVAALAKNDGWQQPYTETVAGFELKLINHLEGSMDSTAPAAIKKGGWDFVVLQENAFWSTETAGNPLAFKKAASDLFEMIKTYNSKAVVVLFETWAAAAQHGVYTSGQFASPASMQEQVRVSYVDAATNYIPAHTGAFHDGDIRLAPVGDGFERHYAGVSPFSLHGADLLNANDSGNYMASLILYGTIFNRSVQGFIVPAPLAVTPDQRESILSTANSTLGF